jgi:hypothetical protein
MRQLLGMLATCLMEYWQQLELKARATILAIILVGVFCIAGFTGGLVDEEGSRELLQEQGYTEIVIGNYDWWGCGDGDWWQTEFSAISPNGQTVTGTVCKGLWKKKTIRFN